MSAGLPHGRSSIQAENIPFQFKGSCIKTREFTLAIFHHAPGILPWDNHLVFVTPLSETSLSFYYHGVQDTSRINFSSASPHSLVLSLGNKSGAPNFKPYILSSLFFRFLSFAFCHEADRSDVFKDVPSR